MEDAGLPQGSTKTLPVPMGPVDSPLPQPPVLETGEAGPPGRMIASKLPKGTDGSMKPVQGFAGAPGETDTYLHSPLPHYCFSCLILLFYLTASPNAKFTDTPKSSTPLTSGKYSYRIILLHPSRVCQRRIKLTVLLANRCEPASQTITTQTRPGLRLRVYSSYSFLPLLT